VGFSFFTSHVVEVALETFFIEIQYILGNADFFWLSMPPIDFPF